MVQEKTLELTEIEELLVKERMLVLCNDNVNTFDFVIDSLVKICHHTAEQAEQCAYIVHFNGKCSVKNGTYDGLKPLKEALSDLGLSVVIE